MHEKQLPAIVFLLARVMLLTALIATQNRSVNAQGQDNEIVLRAAVGKRLEQLLTLEGKPLPAMTWPEQWYKKNTKRSLDDFNGHPVLFVTFTGWLQAA